LTPAAVLIGSGVVAWAVLHGAGSISRALDARFQAVPPALEPARPGADVPPAASSGTALAATASAAPSSPAPAGSTPLELPIVTYDSFDRRFAGALSAEAERRCWGPAVARGASEDTVYLRLNVAVDGSVQSALLEEGPRGRTEEPEQVALRPLRQCVAEIVRGMRFMRLPEPVTGAYVAAHRPKR
jgi:hypothetical protein